MAIPPPRTRTSGGSMLIIVGIVLALATAVLVLFLTNGSGGSATSGTAIVVSNRALTTGTVLSATNSASPYVKVGDAFRVEHVPVSAVPADAFTFTNQADLDTALNGQLITDNFLAGDILRKSDRRMTALGDGPLRSLTNHDPAVLPNGFVLYALHADAVVGMQVGAQEGDHVDVLATACGNGHGGCQITQTTLQNLLIYAVPDGKTIICVLSHQDAIYLKFLVESTKIDLVLRKPGDTAPVTTQAVDAASVMSHYGFTPPGS